MNKIEELIQKLCPEGVAFKELQEVCDFKRGMPITQKDAVEGEIPVIAGGQKPSYYHNVANRTGETIAVSSSGAYAGFVSYWTIPVFLSDSFSVNPKIGVLLAKYVFYFLKHIQRKIHDTKKGGGVPHVHVSSIANFLIPVPPLPIQQEIVNILDKFTELTAELDAELTAELEARKKQYEYYRNNLLTPVDVNGRWMMNGKEVEWKTLGEVCKMKAGKSISASDISNLKLGEYIYPCIGGNGIRGYVKAFSHNGSFPIIGRQGALCGNIYFAEGKFYATEHAVVVAHKEELNTHFFYYLLIIMNLNQYATGGAQPGLAVSKLEKIRIPVPPLSEQERIAGILDKFDALVNDISSGIPAEIAARRKQYEYYRSKLLSFKEKP